MTVVWSGQPATYRDDELELVDDYDPELDLLDDLCDLDGVQDIKVFSRWVYKSSQQALRGP